MKGIIQNIKLAWRVLTCGRDGIVEIVCGWLNGWLANVNDKDAARANAEIVAQIATLLVAISERATSERIRFAVAAAAEVVRGAARATADCELTLEEGGEIVDDVCDCVDAWRRARES